MSTEPIRIIVKEPGKPAEVRNVEPALEIFQGIVGGLIQCVPGDAMGLPETVDVFCNEDGQCMRLDANLHIDWGVLLGPVYFVSYNEEGRTVGLSDHHVEAINEWLLGRSL